MPVVFTPDIVRISAFGMCLMLAAPAAAQEPPSPPATTKDTVVATMAAVQKASGLPPAAEARPLVDAAQARPLVDAAPPRRPGALLPLYGSLIALQGLDVHATRRALASDSAREANPAMRPIVKNSAAFVAVKASATAGVIWASEKAWKKHRKAAVISAVLLNAAMAAIVARNYQVTR